MRDINRARGRLICASPSTITIDAASGTKAATESTTINQQHLSVLEFASQELVHHYQVARQQILGINTQLLHKLDQAHVPHQ